jgi:hypothetical protein
MYTVEVFYRTSTRGMQMPNIFKAIYTNPIRTSHEAYNVCATKSNRLFLLRETVAVYCDNRTEQTDTGNTLRLRYRAQPVNALWGNSRCLL